MKDELEDLMKDASEIYDLGIRMHKTFGGDSRSFMIMAIAACIKSNKSKATFSIDTPLTGRVGDVIRQLRKERGFTLRQIEDATGISNSYLSQLENGKILKPSHDVVTKIMAVLNSGETINNSDQFNPLVPGSGLKGL